MHRQPRYKTKIVAGRLITVPIYDDDSTRYFNGNLDGNYACMERNALVKNHSSDLAQLNLSARLEAQQNKARAQENKAKALLQTYRSVLSPQLISYDEIPSNDIGFNCQIATAISSVSRYKLLTILSAMRRRDPEGTGVLTKMDVQDVLDINNIILEHIILQKLFMKYETSQNAVNYRRMWLFVMDCHANKEKNLTEDPQRKSESLPYEFFNNKTNRERCGNIDILRSAGKSAGISPGLKAVLEYELRHFARINQSSVNTKHLQERLESLDPYKTGKLLLRKVFVICKEDLTMLSTDILKAALSTCDTDESGLVNYHLFLKLLHDAQPTYLPPICDRQLLSNNCNQYSDQYYEHGHNEGSIMDDGEEKRKESSYNNYLMQQYREHFSTVDERRSIQKKNDDDDHSLFHKIDTAEGAFELSLPLNEFETRIYSPKSPQVNPGERITRQSTFTKDSGDTVNSYEKLSRTPVDGDIKVGRIASIANYDEDSPPVKTSLESPRDVSASERSSSELPVNGSLTLPPIPNLKANMQFSSTSPSSCSSKSHRMLSSKVALSKSMTKRGNRKQWNKINHSFIMDLYHTCGDGGLSTGKKSIEVEKWWKNENIYMDEKEYDSISDHRKWSQSNRLRTIKGKRKKKKKVKGSESIGANKIVDVNHTADEKTDMDSAFYSTTDYEVEDDGGLLITEKLSKYYAEFESDDEVLNPIANDLHTCELATAAEEKNRIADSSRIYHSETLNSENTIKDFHAQKKDSISEEVQEKLQLECFSSSIEDAIDLDTIEIDGNHFPVYSSKAFDSSIQKATPSCKTSTKATEHQITTTNALENRKLRLEYVYGHGGGIIYPIALVGIIFYVGNVAVIMDEEKLAQRFFRKHTLAITSMAIHPDGVTAASSQKRSKNKCIIYVWNCIDLSLISSISIDSIDECSISVMDFSSKLKYNHFLAAIQNCDDAQNLCIYDWKRSLLMHTLQTGNVNGILFSPEESFLTYGKLGHLRFYSIEKGNLKVTEGNFGDLVVAKNIGCAVWGRQGNIITGDSNGTIYVWNKELLRIDHCIHNAHNGPISAMAHTMHGYLLTSSSKDKKIVSWDTQMRRSSHISLPSSFICTKSLCISKHNLFIATSSNALVKIVLKDSGDPLQKANDNILPFSEGHSDIITGLAAHPCYNEMVVTLSADGNVQMYNTDSKNVVWTTTVKGNGSSVTFHPQMDYIAIGCQDGSIHLIMSISGDFVDKFKDSRSSITYLQFSPDGTHLACGSYDGQIILYSFDGKCKELDFCHAYQVLDDCINFIDWEISCTLVRVQSGNRDIRYYDTSMKNVIGNSKEFSWASNTCSISYETSGLWKNSTISQHSVVFDTSFTNSLMVYSSQGSLFLVRYPWVDEQALYTSAPTCVAGAKPIVRFAVDCHKLYVAYDNGGCLWQWSMK